MMEKKLGLVILVFWLVGCSSPTKIKPVSGEQIFVAPFDKVWRATQIALVKYPIRTNNIDQGILETDNIHSYDGWKPPHKSAKKSGGLYYKLLIKVIKGRYREREVTKVIVSKKINLKRSFFSENQERQSDGLEEKVILYRIKRELKIERAFERSDKKTKESENS